MYAERAILTTDPSGNLTGLPQLPPNRKVEAILLVLDEPGARTKRAPHPDLAGAARIQGDVISSVPPSDWEPEA